MSKTTFKNLIIVLAILYLGGSTLFAQSPGGVNGPDGTVTNPFTSLGEARAVVTIDGAYNFNLSGNTFSTFVSSDGWVLLASNDETAPQVALPIATTVAKGVNGILSATTFAQLTGATEVRIHAERGTNAGTVDAVSTNATVLSRLVAFQAFGVRDGVALTSQWGGVLGVFFNPNTPCNTGATTGGATNYELSHNIIHNCNNGGGIHWIPGISSANVNNGQTGDTGFNLYARGAISSLPLKLWLKADAGVTGATSVSQWDDQSGSGRDVTQANTAAQPTYNSTVNLMNFNATLEYDGGDVLFRSNTLVTEYADNTGGTVFGVGTKATSGIHNHYFNQYENTSNFALHFGEENLGPLINYGGGGSGSGGEVALNIPTISVGVYNNVLSTVYRQGIQIATSSIGNSGFNINPSAAVGGTGTGTGTASPSYEGLMTEVIVYHEDLSTAERNQVESYLAIKYGVTLDASVANYVNSSGASIYSLASSNNDVFGIMNDAASGLDQQISKSVNTGSVVTLSTDNDLSSANGLHASLTDGQALVIGNNGGATTTQTTEIDGSIYFERVTREWRVENTGSVGAVNLLFAGFDETYVLLTDVDGDFSSGATNAGPLNSAGAITSIALTDGMFFTLARLATSIEFDLATASDVEATGGNFPDISIQGTLFFDTDIDIVINAAGTATAGADYTFGTATGDALQTVTVTIPAGVYTLGTTIALSSLNVSGGGSVTFAITDEAIVEGNEIIDLTLSNAQNGLVIQEIQGGALINNHIYTITNDDSVIVEFNISNSNSGELFGLNLPTLFVTGTVTNATTVTVTDAGTGSATAGSDYTFTSPQVVNISAGVYDGTAGTAVAIPTLSITNDAIVESTETIALTLGTATGDATLGTTLVHTYSIFDDDSVIIQFNAATANDAEAAGGNLPTLFITGTVTNATTVTVTDAGTGSATAGSDYTFTSPQVVNISAGVYDGTAGTAVAIPTLSITNDAIVESTETIALTLGTATGDASLGAATTHTYTINNDDNLTVDFNAATYTSTGETGTLTLTLDVSGAQITAAESIEIDITGGTATGVGTDYTFTDPTSVTIPIGNYTTPGTVTASIVIATDAIVEGNETILLGLINPSANVSVGTQSTATATITDDDALTVDFNAATYASVGETGTLTLTLDVSGADITATESIQIDVTGGTATGGGTDYMFADPTSVTIPIGNYTTPGTVTASITIATDAIQEGNETILLGLITPSANVSVGTQSTATATITDDDALTVDFNAATYTSAGETGTLTLTLDVSGAQITATESIQIDVTGGTATGGGTDYTFADPTSVTIPIGNYATPGTVTANITIVADTALEANETILLGLINPSANVSVGTQSTATATITDDDCQTVTGVSIALQTNNEASAIDVSWTEPTPASSSYTIKGFETDPGLLGAAAATADKEITANSGSTTATLTGLGLLSNTQYFVYIISECPGGAQQVVSAGNITTEEYIYSVAVSDTQISEDGSNGPTSTTFTAAITNGTNFDDRIAFIIVKLGRIDTGGAGTIGFVDYAGNPNVGIAQNANSGTSSISVFDDLKVEVDETFEIGYLADETDNTSTPTITSATLGTTSLGTFTVSSDDVTTVQILNPSNGTEGGANGSFDVVIANQPEFDTQITFTPTGSATSGTDYSAITITVTGAAQNSNFLDVFSPAANGAGTETVTVTITDDAVIEVLETATFTITGTNQTPVTLGTTTAQNVTITDNDSGALAISIGTPVNGTEGGTDISYTVSLDGGVTNGTGAAITGTVALSGTATSGTDYTNVTSFSIADGASSGTITVGLIDDGVVEISETVIATISTPSVGSIGTAASTATLSDNDTAGLTISIGSPVNGTEGGTNVSYTVSLDGGASNGTGAAITGTVALSGTATNVTDYTNVTSFSIADGASSGTITVTLTDDTNVESNETVIATISAPSIGSVGTAAATATITDDDICNMPTALNISDIQILTADVSWATPSGGTVTDYQWVIMNSGGNPDTDTPVTSGTTVAGVTMVDDASALIKGIDYDFYVRSVCSITASSAYAGPGAFTTLFDNDDDGIDDTTDPDDDNDGISDIDEDVDGDGNPNNDDSDGDGIPDYFDVYDPNGDDDGDGVPNGDEDIDGDGNPNNDDSDGDGIPNYIDTDDDNDGILNVDEDIDGDGNPDNDDSDGDGIPDYLDPFDPNGDDDGDGISNGDEDIDGDGNPNNDDSDGDGIPDYLDEFDPNGDDDGDGISNGDEDADGDGNPNNDDSDGDGIPDYLDVFDPNGDDDGDGVSNGDEDTDGDGNPYNDDCDDDGIPNFIDEDSCGTITVVAEAFTPNGDGLNDTWVIQDIELFPNAVIQVYNRWGHEIFKARNYQNDWSGNYKSNSGKIPAGSYYYVIDLGNELAPVTGWIFINY